MAKLRLAQGGLSLNFDKIVSIKAVRQLTGLGLKESKDAVEAVILGGMVDLDSSDPAVAAAVSNESHYILLAQGLELIQGTTKVDFIIIAIKESAKLAADEEEEELAVLLLDVVCRHKENIKQRESKQETQREAARERKHAESVRQDEISVIRDRQEELWDNNRKRSHKRSQEEIDASTDHRI